MPASATFAMIAARSLSSASASEQQCPATMRPLNLWRSAASAICPSERALGESLSSTWKSRSRPFALAASNSLSSIASLRGPGASPRNVKPPSTPPCFATVSTVKRNSASSVERAVDRKQRDRLQRDAAFPLLAHLGEHAPRDLGLLRIAVDMRAQRAGAVREGAAQREVHAPGARPRATSWPNGRPSRHCARRDACRPDFARDARCGPCRYGCARRRGAAARCRCRGRRGRGRPAPPGRSRRCARCRSRCCTARGRRRRARAARRPRRGTPARAR